MGTKREFFAIDLEEARQAASRKLGIPVDELRYEVLDESFGHLLTETKIGIVVEYDERATTTAPSEDLEDKLREEKKAKEAGDVEWARFLLTGILERMQLDAKVSSYEWGEHVILALELPEEGFDWRRGECRELRGAIQHVINRAVSTGREMERRFIIDIGGRLEERTAEMAVLADSLAGQIARLDKPLHIHLMDSQDRRLLHLGLVTNKQVQTESRGEKQFRVLSVEPANSNKNEG